MNVKTVGNVLNGKNICHNIKQHILEKNHMNVKTVGNASAINMCYRDIEEHIWEKNHHMNVKTVGNASAVKYILQSHKRTHTGKKPFEYFAICFSLFSLFEFIVLYVLKIA